MMAFLKIFFLIGLLLSAGCISFTPKPSERKMATEISFKPPVKPYVEFKLELADHAWQNKSSGNTISYMSSCESDADMSLESLYNLATDGIENLKVVDQNHKAFNQRESLTTHLTGRVDGVPVQIYLTIFKKHNCTFNISYVAGMSTYSDDFNTFRNFLMEFKVP